MDELLAKIAAETGLEPSIAKIGIGHILAYLKVESDDPAVGKMIAETPGAADAVAMAGQDNGDGALGGIMGLGSKLMGLGLDMGQIQIVARELVAFAKVQSDPETVDRALASVPGLSSFV
ncbi:DUF2267 domain-containing protein [Aurantimonas marina]|uniref:DUF2267 domain-containing protein n=1 Tax=Aurantimonas marina TaxID=2780508 RepID=UPI0019D18143|nr:DUF2267 domain-containing protein [Aurantimonas marina]